MLVLICFHPQVYWGQYSSAPCAPNPLIVHHLWTKTWCSQFAWGALVTHRFLISKKAASAIAVCITPERCLASRDNKELASSGDIKTCQAGFALQTTRSSVGQLGREEGDQEDSRTSVRQLNSWPPLCKTMSCFRQQWLPSPPSPT